MIAIALDTATDRCSVAVTDGHRIERRSIDGARRHASALPGLIGDALLAFNAAPAAIERIVTADGPGSFTGLRVSAAIAKGLAWHRTVEWRVAPSLLVRAVSHARPGARVLALTDALRGELFAGGWEFCGDRVHAVAGPPRAMSPASLSQFLPIDIVTGSVPAALVDAVTTATGCVPVIGESAWPDAAGLFTLSAMGGGTTLVANAEAWEPDYGRPAEAQAVWERAHGRPLPVAAHRPG
jgi:tRNA threonylcarbamoyladenosine biosynthesis protein TsaB